MRTDRRKFLDSGRTCSVLSDETLSHDLVFTLTCTHAQAYINAHTVQTQAYMHVHTIIMHAQPTCTYILCIHYQIIHLEHCLQQHMQCSQYVYSKTWCWQFLQLRRHYWTIACMLEVCQAGSLRRPHPLCNAYAIPAHIHRPAHIIIQTVYILGPTLYNHNMYVCTQQCPFAFQQAYALFLCNTLVHYMDL